MLCSEANNNVIVDKNVNGIIAKRKLVSSELCRQKGGYPL